MRDIGDGSCNGFAACELLFGSVGNYSCNGDEACFELMQAIGDCEMNLVRINECLAALRLATPVCIESALVQTHPNAAKLSVGSRFLGGADAIEYEIITGGSFCSFNCLNGFDINCDGVIGDFCPIELDLRKVADVGTCLALTAPAEQPAAALFTPVSAPAGGLAHTGTELTLVAGAFTLIAAGAASTALATRRRHARD